MQPWLQKMFTHELAVILNIFRSVRTSKVSSVPSQVVGLEETSPKLPNMGHKTHTQTVQSVTNARVNWIGLLLPLKC